MSRISFRMLLTCTSVLACCTLARTLEAQVGKMQDKKLVEKPMKDLIKKLKDTSHETVDVKLKDAAFLEHPNKRSARAQSDQAIRSRNSAVGVGNDVSEVQLNEFTDLLTDQAIPKIIHFMFKETPKQMKGKWPNPVWKTSYDSWKKYFPEPEFHYKFWTDSSIAKFFARHCSTHEGLFKSYTNEISRSDLSRYCILKEMGGIYTDLDYEPRTNFYNDLPKGHVSLVESPYARETFQNSLMASPVGQKFQQYWTGVMDLAEKHFKGDPVKASGPKLLDDFEESHDNSVVYKLPCADYQLKVHPDNDKVKDTCAMLTAENVGKVKGIHWGTWSWFQTGSGKNQNADTLSLFSQLHGDMQHVLLQASEDSHKVESHKEESHKEESLKLSNLTLELPAQFVKLHSNIA